MTRSASRLRARAPRHVLALAAACLAAAPASAAAPAASPPAESPLVDVALGDLDGDGAQDAALLSFTDESSGTLGLAVHLRDPSSGLLALAQTIDHAAWGSRIMAGQEPRIVVRDGMLILTTQNVAVGLEHWEVALETVLEDGALVVVGYESLFSDARGPEPRVTSCRLDLRAGYGLVDEEPFAFPAGARPLEGWERPPGEPDFGLALCRAHEPRG